MLAIETLLGALTGYFTNDIAIHQLFSKNGMVVREREQFTTLIVQVLKNRIIDADTMDALCERPEMVAFFEEFVQGLLGEVIPEAFGKKCLADYDVNGALQGIVKGHIADTLLEDAVFDVQLLYEHIDECVQSDVFKQALTKAVQQVAELSMDTLGIAEILDNGFLSFEQMDDAAWQKWLGKKREQVKGALMHQECIAENDEPKLLKAVFSVDGEILIEKLESYFGLELSQSTQLMQFKVYYTHFLEQLYVFAARVLPQVMENHLPALVDVLYPMLQADRKWLEQMVLDSIEECNDDGNMILSMASGYVEKFFAPDENDRDWLTKLYDSLKTGDEKSRMCIQLADFLCGLLMKQIDEWRRLDLEDEEDLQKVRVRYQTGRARVVKALDAYLSMPVQGNPVHRVILQALTSLTFAWIGKSVSAKDMHAWIEKIKTQWMSQSLEQLFLNEKRQVEWIDIFCKWWHTEGMSWLSCLDIGGTTLKRWLYKAVDGLFDIPLNQLIGHAQGFFPYEQLADGLRMSFFEHLRDFLAGLTREQLDALSHEEIREVILDILGREMRPLAYLGGGIGAVAGVATGAVMQVSGMDSEQVSMLFAARSGLYGAVGYGTNVMAVKGLFWPYKKTLGFQGLICKNQERFATKMKNMAESYIINDDIWMQQVEHFSKRIGQHDDDILRYALHLMDENRENALRPFIERMSHEGPHQVCSLVFEEAQIANLMQNLSDVGIRACLNHQKMGQMASRLQVFHRVICKLAMAEARERVWSEKLTTMLHGFSEENWVTMGNTLLEQCHFPKKEVFYDKVWQQVVPFYRTLSDVLIQYTPDIVDSLDRFVSKKLSFPLQLAYRMAGGNRQIERVVRYFITKKLPDYVQAKEMQVEMRLKQWAMMQFSGRSLMACGVTMSNAQGQWLFEEIQAVQAEQLHQHALALFMCVEKWPISYMNALTKDVAIITQPFVEDLVEYLQQTKATQCVSWETMAHCLVPVLEIVQEKGLREVSVGAMLSFSDERVWAWCDEMLHLSEVEKCYVIKNMQALWHDVAPIFWQAIGQRGRVLMMMVDIPSLTQERICALSPQELEMMVRDIAQPYFTRVERMGWLGAVVAVPATMLSTMLGGL